MPPNGALIYIQPYKGDMFIVQDMYSELNSEWHILPVSFLS